MPRHEEKLRGESAVYETNKEHRAKNLLSKKIEFESHEPPPAVTRFDAERLHERAPENDLAFSVVEESHSKAIPIRYEGGTNWSPEALEKIGSFFRQQFGRPLPISAMGQSDTHKRLGLDHRDSVDVPLRPESLEGRDLMAYLRSSGIPIAFSRKLSSMSTGAHIHIGRPSPRLIQMKQQVRLAQERNDRAEADDG